MPRTTSIRCAGLLALLVLGGCGGASQEQRPGAWLREVAAERGLDFTHAAGVDGRFFLPEHLATGAAWLDHDGDGDLDVYLLSASTPNRLFRNDTASDGTARFIDVTAGSGLDDEGYGMAVAVGDLDNDGDVDVYVANFGADALYRNDGGGRFTDVTRAAGIANEGWTCAVTFLDFDADGWLDLYVGNYLDYSDPLPCTDDAGRLEYCGPKTFPPQADVLYRNQGDGTFRDVSAELGIASKRAHTLGVLADDFDGDGRVDVLAANDADPNSLWLQQPDGTFRESGAERGIAVNAYGAPEAGMGLAYGDVDRDGRLDVLMTHLSTETNTLYLALDEGRFRDATVGSGLGAPSLEFTGFGCALIDLDHDGLLDLPVVNGRVRRGPGSAPTDDLLAVYRQPNSLYRATAPGRFEDASALGGPAWLRPAMSRSLAVGDCDDDGDLDLLVANTEGPAQLFLNEAEKQGHWLIVRAFDPALNRDAYGARVEVLAGERSFVARAHPGHGYGSSHDPRAHFGLGEVEAIDAIRVRWPDGLVEEFPAPPLDRAVTLERGARLGEAPR